MKLENTSTGFKRLSTGRPGYTYRLVPSHNALVVEQEQIASLCTGLLSAMRKPPEQALDASRHLLAQFHFDRSTNMWVMNGPRGQIGSFHPGEGGIETEYPFIYEGPSLGIQVTWEIDQYRFVGYNPKELVPFGRNHNDQMDFGNEPDSRVSRHHFQAGRDLEGRLLIKDSKSSNGSFLHIGGVTPPTVDEKLCLEWLPEDLANSSQKLQENLHALLEKNGLSLE